MDETRVGDLMTAPVLTVGMDDNAADVGHAMREQGIKSVVVIDDDCGAAGIVTSTDFVAIAADDRVPSETPVREYATTDVVTAAVDDPVSGIAERMRDNDINHLPVVEDEQVVGILTTTDLTEWLSDPPRVGGAN